MSNHNNAAEPAYEPTEEERDADSRADMWCSLGVVFLAWVTAIYWLSNL